MEQRHTWEIDNLQKNNDAQNAKLTDHESRIRSLESFKDTTVERLITVFNMLEDIREGGKWVRRVLTSSLITAIIGAIFSIVLWFLKGG